MTQLPKVTMRLLETVLKLLPFTVIDSLSHLFKKPEVLVHVVPARRKKTSIKKRSVDKADFV
jgi:hypothetical protein